MWRAGMRGLHTKSPPPRPPDLEGEDGARGIRTPKPFRALAFEASAIPFCQRSNDRQKTGRLAAEQIGAPGFEPGTSATRTQRSTGLSHAPDPTRVKHDKNGDAKRGRHAPDLAERSWLGLPTLGMRMLRIRVPWVRIPH